MYPWIGPTDQKNRGTVRHVSGREDFLVDDLPDSSGSLATLVRFVSQLTNIPPQCSTDLHFGVHDVRDRHVAKYDPSLGAPSHLGVPNIVRFAKRVLLVCIAF